MSSQENMDLAYLLLPHLLKVPENSNVESNYSTVLDGPFLVFLAMDGMFMYLASKKAS